MTTPATLQENAGLFFLGEVAWPPAILPARAALRLAAQPNPCGRPNSDVLRRRLAVVDGAPVKSWQIDFPDHFTAQEAALYEQPFARLRQSSADAAWLNPHAQAGLRRALARVSRWLALPVDATAPDWRLIEEDLLPDATLLVVARDDDFTHGILQSTPFAVWHHAHHHRLGPVQIVESFPFPWPPTTALSALTATQEEQRHAIARAARSGDVEQLNAAVLAAYGWPGDITDHELLPRLLGLHARHISG